MVLFVFIVAERFCSAALSMLGSIRDLHKRCSTLKCLFFPDVSLVIARLILMLGWACNATLDLVGQRVAKKDTQFGSCCIQILLAELSFWICGGRGDVRGMREM